MSQSRKLSAVEVCASTAIGYVIAVASQAAIFPMFDVHVSLQTSATMGLWLTIVSIVRTYVLRRAFNRWGGKR